MDKFWSRMDTWATLATVLVGLLIFFLASSGSAPADWVLDQPDPTVRVERSDSVGSGFHLGNGMIVTAAHVVGDEKSVKVKTARGVTMDAEVLWTNTVRDTALLKIKLLVGDSIGVAELVCRAPVNGERVRAEGNPNKQEFLSTYGRIGGEARTMNDMWVVPLSMTIIPGMSGGPVFDMDNKVVAMTSMVMVTPVGFGASLTGIGFGIPASSICELLATKSV